MRVIDRERYSHVLLERGGEWMLTFLVGRAVMRDVSVRLTDTEIAGLEDGDISAADLVERFSADRATYEGRKVTPAVWPAREDEETGE